MTQLEEDVLTYMLQKRTVQIEVSLSDDYDAWAKEKNHCSGADLPHRYMAACLSLVNKGVLERHERHHNLFATGPSWGRIIEQYEDYLQQRRCCVSD